jgi:hypothetical protein
MVLTSLLLFISEGKLSLLGKGTGTGDQESIVSDMTDETAEGTEPPPEIAMEEMRALQEEVNNLKRKNDMLEREAALAKRVRPTSGVGEGNIRQLSNVVRQKQTRELSPAERDNIIRLCTGLFPMMKIMTTRDVRKNKTLRDRLLTQLGYKPEDTEKADVHALVMSEVQKKMGEYKQNSIRNVKGCFYVDVKNKVGK